MNRFRTLQADPNRALAQAVEYRITLGGKNFRVPELMLEFTSRAAMGNMYFTAKAAVDRNAMGANGPVVPGHLTRECHVISSFFDDYSKTDGRSVLARPNINSAAS
jgi:hypothetical protein